MFRQHRPVPDERVVFGIGGLHAGLERLGTWSTVIREGTELCIDVMEIDKWGKQGRIDRCL
jgi:hypothetical protein